MGKNKGLLAEVWAYLRVRKKWWLLPILLMLIVVSLILILGQSSAISPLIYAML